MENKKQLVRAIRTHDLTRLSLKSYPPDNKSLHEGIHRVFVILSKKKIKFSAQKLVILKKTVPEIWQKFPKLLSS